MSSQKTDRVKDWMWIWLIAVMKVVAMKKIKRTRRRRNSIPKEIQSWNRPDVG